MCRGGSGATGHSRGTCQARQVWSPNLEEEFAGLLAALSASGPGAILAFDITLPGALDDGQASGVCPTPHRRLCKSVALLQPLQLGVAIASDEGALAGAWNFNLLFDVTVDHHTQAALASLVAAGIDFQMHAGEGVDAARLKALLRASPLLGGHQDGPWWVTFAGTNMGHLLKLVTGRALPKDAETFNAVLSTLWPQRTELADGSDRKGSGCSACAGCGALDAMELYLQRRQRAGAWLSGISPPPPRAIAAPIGEANGDDLYGDTQDVPIAAQGLHAAAAGCWARAARAAMYGQP